jgi:hypothetical protein
MSKDSTKDLIREELQKLSKDDLINIVEELVSAYATASINTRMANANCIQQCFNQIRTNTQTAINGMVQELSVSFQQIDG